LSRKTTMWRSCVRSAFSVGVMALTSLHLRR
jgi:hypothetical protein